MTKFIIGIDEVGRGCLAGPVTVVAVAWPLKLKIKYQISKTQIKNKKLPLRDSKKLSEQQRNNWFLYVKNNPQILYAKASVYPKVIDRINISQAANLAATRAVKKLCSTIGDRNVRSVLLDGGLYINNFNSIIDHIEPRTIVKGDEKFNCIKLASVVAKVSRDRLMKRLHKKYPQYGFDIHKGYGTKVHIQAIKKHGQSEIHRTTFLKNFLY